MTAEGAGAKYFRCESCARGTAVELAVDPAVVAVIAPCPQVYERGDESVQCRGPMVHRAYLGAGGDR